jgi:SAM-dependent methyltransferase
LRCERHSQTWIEPAELGSCVPPFLPTFPSGAKFLAHRQFLSDYSIDRDGLIIADIPGWLRREDAIKLFEMAYFAQGDILDLGCHQGLSTSIIAQAVWDRGGRKGIASIDKSPAHVARAVHNLSRKSLRQLVDFTTADAVQYCKLQSGAGRQFGFIFIDHSHEYADVVEVCRTFPQILALGAFCLFHDFNDGRNNSRERPDYGVSHAVYDTLKSPSFEFYGMYGCTALYRRTA